MTNWSLTYGGVTVTLPLGTREINDDGDTATELFEQDGDRPIIFVKHPSEDTVVIMGSIYVAGQTNAYLNTTYLVPLKAMKSHEVLVTSPDAQYDGYWLLKSISFRRVAEGAFIRYMFVITIVQGADIIEL